GGDAGLHQSCAAGFAAHAQSCLRHVEAICMTEPAEPFHVGPGAAPAVENASRRSARGLPDERLDERAKAVEPEMMCLSSSGCPQQIVHLRQTSISVSCGPLGSPSPCSADL